MRKTRSLNFDWRFIPDYKEQYLSSDFDFSSWEIVHIPHTMKELPINYFNEKDSQLIGVYSKTFELDQKALKNNLFLEFKGVMNKAIIYLNHKQIYTNEGGYNPFTIEINQHALLGVNKLLVIVDSNEIKNIPPFGGLVDYLPFSGIYREVFLLEKPKSYIKHLQIATDEANVMDQSEMILQFKLIANDDKDYLVRIKLIDENNIVILEKEFSEVLQSEGFFQTIVKDIKRWDIDNPQLYNLSVSLVKDNEIIDTVTERFGFRTVLFTENGFLLNNKKIKLMGLNRHQSYPYVGYAAPKSMQEMDADILKDLGCNIVRTSHYLQSDHFLNRCDETGLLVFEEIPGWNYIGDEHFKELSLKNLEAMITNHLNHPSICLWGVRINESKDDEDFYLRTNELARKLDPTRQTGGVRNFKKSQLLEDVYTYNDFSHTGENAGLEEPRKVLPFKAPYLVTEYNGHVFPTKKTDSQVRRTEHALRHLNVIEYNYYYDNLSGAIGWCMADYNTHFQFGANDRICHHGVLDIHRIEKYAAYAYKSQKDPQTEPILFVSSNMIAGDYDLLKLPDIIVFTNCDYLKLYKNDQLIGTYYPDEDYYDHLPHAPVIIDDLIGKTLEKSEDFSQKDAKKIKKVLLSFNKHGFDMPLKMKLTAALLYLRKKVTMDSAMILFGRYLANQEMTPTIFKFEGYLNDEVAITVKKGHSTNFSIRAKVDREKLTHGLTYDMVRVIIEMVDQFGNVLDYGNEIVEVQTDNSLVLVGPKSIALNGGSTAIYLKTNNIFKNSKVNLKFNNYPDIELNFVIEKGILEF